MDKIKIRVPRKKLEEFCCRNHIRKLAFFGSVRRENLGPESDIDVLVEFGPGKMPGWHSLVWQKIWNKSLAEKWIC